MSDEKMFQEAVSAAQQGQRERARDLLTRLLHNDQKQAKYWVWMSAVVNSPSERVYCLQNALKLDPNNAAARRGLILSGGMTDNEAVPVPPPKRHVLAAETPTTPDGKKATRVQLYIQKLPPFLRAKPVLFGILGVVVLICLIGGGVLVGSMIGTPTPTARAALNITPKVWASDTPTATSTPTTTPTKRWTTVPTKPGLTPLWAQVQSTYTPTPRYIDTPHPISEAYIAGLRSYDAQKYDEMFLRMGQASDDEPAAIDLVFFTGEALRLLKRYDEAIDAFTKAIKQNPNFAPSYVGRARSQLAIDPEAEKEILADLDKATQIDPNYVDGFLERAAFRITLGEAEAAIKDLEMAENLRPDIPSIYMMKAQANLLVGENELALNQAETAYQMDFTLLPNYLVLARAYLANNQPEEALNYIKTYNLYVKDDIEAALVIGIAQYQSGGDYQVALESFDNVLKVNKRDAEAYYYRGLTYLKLSDAQKAVNDFSLAVSLKPRIFRYNLELGKALLAAKRVNDASRQYEATLNLAETDAELAEIHYWRALLFEQTTNLRGAAKEWMDLLALPEDSAPAEWRETARTHLLALTPTITSTRTMVPTNTPRPTRTPIPTNTPRPTRTPVPTNTPRPTKTPAPTLTPVPTRTPKPTRTPVPTLTPVPTKTPRPTLTPIPTKSATPTKTIPPTQTPLSTKTPAPTQTLVPTKTYTPGKTSTLSPTPKS